MEKEKNKKFTSLELPRFCMGSEALGGADWGDFDLNELTRVFSLAFERGVRFFDVADCYGLGQAEENLANALSGKRHEVIIATKGGVRWQCSKGGRAQTWIDLDVSYLEKALYASLKRLRLDCIPVYFLHHIPDEYDVRKISDFINKAKEKKLIRHFGLSNLRVNNLEEFLRHLEVDLVQLPINILNSPLTNSMADICRNNDVKIVSYSSLASGLLTGKFDLNTKFLANDRRSRLKEYCGDNYINNLKKIAILKSKAADCHQSLTHYSIDQLFLRYKEISSVIVGIKSLNQLDEALGIFR